MRFFGDDMFDHGDLFGVGFFIVAFVVSEHACKLFVTFDRVLITITMLQAVLKLSIVSPPSVGPQKLALAVCAVKSPLTLVQNFAVVTKAVT